MDNVFHCWFIFVFPCSTQTCANTYSDDSKTVVELEALGLKKQGKLQLAWVDIYFFGNNYYYHNIIYFQICAHSTKMKHSLELTFCCFLKRKNFSRDFSWKLVSWVHMNSVPIATYRSERVGCLYNNMYHSCTLTHEWGHCEEELLKQFIIVTTKCLYMIFKPRQTFTHFITYWTKVLAGSRNYIHSHDMSF